MMRPGRLHYGKAGSQEATTAPVPPCPSRILSKTSIPSTTGRRPGKRGCIAKLPPCPPDGEVIIRGACGLLGLCVSISMSNLNMPYTLSRALSSAPSLLCGALAGPDPATAFGAGAGNRSLRDPLPRLQARLQGREQLGHAAVLCFEVRDPLLQLLNLDRGGVRGPGCRGSGGNDNLRCQQDTAK